MWHWTTTSVFVSTSLMFVSTSGLEVSVVVEELSSLSARLSLSSSPWVFTVDFFSFSSFFLWAFVLPRGFPLDSKRKPYINNNFQKLYMITAAFCSSSPSWYLCSVETESSAPVQLLHWATLDGRGHCPWLLSGWHILHHQGRGPCEAETTRINFDFGGPVVWRSEPSGWLADRQVGGLLGLSLNFL